MKIRSYAGFGEGTYDITDDLGGDRRGPSDP